MRILVILLFFLLTLNADETLTRLFTQLKTVPKSDKFKVVNEIKKHIIALKQQERVEAIKVLQEKKRAEQKQAEVEHLHTEHGEDAHEMKDCKADKEMMGKKHPMKQSDMPNMDSMPKMENMLKNMNSMRNMEGMKNLTNRQKFPITEEERLSNRQNMREGMGRK